MKTNKALLYEVVYDLPYHKNNIATVEATSREAAEEKVQSILTRSGKGKVRKGCVHKMPVINA